MFRFLSRFCVYFIFVARQRTCRASWFFCRNWLMSSWWAKIVRGYKEKREQETVQLLVRERGNVHFSRPPSRCFARPMTMLERGSLKLIIRLISQISKKRVASNTSGHLVSSSHPQRRRRIFLFLPLVTHVLLLSSLLLLLLSMFALNRKLRIKLHNA